MSLSAVRCQNQSTALIPLDRTQTFPVRHAFHPVWSKIESMAESWGRSRAHVYGSHLGPGFVVGDRHEQYITWRKTTATLALGQSGVAIHTACACRTFKLEYRR